MGDLVARVDAALAGVPVTLEPATARSGTTRRWWSGRPAACW